MLALLANAVESDANRSWANPGVDVLAGQLDGPQQGEL